MRSYRWLTVISGFTVLAVMCASSCAAAEILECYKCFDGPNENRDDPLRSCAELQNTAEFKRSCANSTMCEKTIYSMILQDGMKWTVERRDCAMQANVIYVLVNRTYEPVTVIEEAYQEECIVRHNPDMLSSTIRQCFCRGHLCNSATYRDLSAPTIMLSIVFLLLFHARGLPELS